MDVMDDFIEAESSGTESDGEIGSYFRQYLLNLRKTVRHSEFKHFTGMDKNADRVAFVLKYPEAYQLPVSCENIIEKKDSKRAKYLKDRGNKLFCEGRYDEAIVEYSNAVLLAPKDELPVVLGNRSAAFYHLSQFETALVDCEEALKLGYPKHLLYKLEERRARCLLGLKIHWQAMDAFKKSIVALDDAEIPLEKKKKFEYDMRMMIAVMDRGQELNDEKGITKEMIMEHENKIRVPKNLLPKLKQPNHLYPACSSAVEIKDDGGDVGRHAIATRDVAPGEILAVEKAHCSFLLAEYRLTHCHRCLMRIVAPFPATCYECNSIAYCSPTCRDSDKEIHATECSILGVLWTSKSSITCILALRAIIQQPFDEFLKSKDQIDVKFEVSKDLPYLGKDYRAFCNLVTHEDERTPEDLFHRAFIASWLLRVLKTTKYFPATVRTPDCAEIPLSDGERFVAGELLRNLQLLQFNSHEISEFTRAKGNPDLTKGKNLFVGGGVFPSVALFNHSCNPGVVRYFIGTTMIVRAIKAIPTGGEISENYGPIFTETPENERKRNLRLQYWFDCNCEACTDHWPVLEDLDSNVLRYKCQTGPSCGNVLLVKTDTEEFVVRCPKCGKNTNMFEGLKALQDTDSLYKSATTNLENGKHDEAMTTYLKILKILDSTLALPLKDYHLCQQRIRQCMLALGNSSVV